jgi:bla regulator protein BlaR1
MIAQSQKTGPAFEVATVRPTGSEVREPIGWFSYPGGRLAITNCKLRQIIQLAYGVDEFQLSGGPGWVGQDSWDITAKAPASSEASKVIPKSFKSPPSPEMLLMLRTLLADRFQLKLHGEMKTRSVYALVVGKKGPKLSETKDHEAFSVVAGGVSDNRDRSQWLRGDNASMEKLARRLAQSLGYPVQDETGLKGEFDFTVEYTDADSLPAAIQDQLGLRIVGRKAAVEYLAIDHVARPSGN